MTQPYNFVAEIHLIRGVVSAFVFPSAAIARALSSTFKVFIATKTMTTQRVATGCIAATRSAVAPRRNIEIKKIHIELVYVGLAHARPNDLGSASVI